MVFSTVPLQSKCGNLQQEKVLRAKRSFLGAYALSLLLRLHQHEPTEDVAPTHLFLHSEVDGAWSEMFSGPAHPSPEPTHPLSKDGLDFAGISHIMAQQKNNNIGMK